MKGYIYKITNPSGRIYIGQTTDIDKRKREYRSLSCKRQPAIYNSLCKYGFEKHLFEIIETIEEELHLYNILNLKEECWIKEYNSHHNGLNCTDGGYGLRGFKHSDITISKLKGRKLTKEHIENLKGKIRTEETLRKMSETQKGKKSSKETIDKIIAIHKGSKRKNETIEKMSKPTIVYDTDGRLIGEYISLGEACNSVGVSYSSAQKVASKILKSIKGYVFFYKINTNF